LLTILVTNQQPTQSSRARVDTHRNFKGAAMQSFDPYRSKNSKTESEFAQAASDEVQGLPNEVPETCDAYMQDDQDHEAEFAGQDDQSFEPTSRQADRYDSRNKQFISRHRTRTEDLRENNSTGNERLLKGVSLEHSHDDLDFAPRSRKQKKHRDSDREFTLDYPSFYDQHRR
jgi:hypothetical protein